MTRIRRPHVAMALAVAAATLLAACGSTDDSGALKRTGQLSDMGMPVFETPGTASGAVEQDGVVLQPAAWNLGQVPLNIAVRPGWTLRNTGTQALTVGQPHAEVRQGCCPGAFVFDQPTTLEPGAGTHFTFELSMHPGMDGPHDMAVHVPITYADGTTGVVTANVTGDFRD